MAFASGADVRVAYIPEVTPGTTPATPTFKVLRVTTGGLRTNKETQVSEERQPDRNVRDELEVGQGAGGTYNFEMSYETFNDIIEGALFGTFGGNILKNGSVRKFFTFEEFIELGATDSFSRFVMGMIASLNLDITARARIVGDFTVMAQKETLATAIIAGATYTAANTKQIMTASSSFAALSVPGGATRVRRIQLGINNNLRGRPEVGSKFSAEFGHGMADVAGTLEAYFENNTLYQAVLDHGGGALSFTIGQDANEKYTIDLPSVRWLDGSRQIGGRDDDLIVSIPFRAKYDATEAASMKVTKAVA